MDLPVKFPSDPEVVAEEVARFRALSPENRVRALGEMFRLYHFLISTSERSEELMRLAEAEEEQQRKAIMEFVARHT